MIHSLVLRPLGPDDKKAFLEGLAAWPEAEQSWHSFEWPRLGDYKLMLERLSKDTRGEEIRPDRVASTMLYAFLDQHIIGRLHIRHTLNESLLLRGGHVGYAVAPPFRRRGYAAEMFRQSIPYLKALGLERILLTCADTNEASANLIEKFGGVLENKVWDPVDQETIRRYWIDLPN